MKNSIQSLIIFLIKM